MTKNLLLTIYLITNFSIFSQSKINGTSYSHFQVSDKNDKIDFVIADTNLNVAKPLLLFCQGSLPTPLFLDLDENGIKPLTLSNFNIKELNEKFHICVISMPHTPLVVKQENLNKQYSYIEDTSNQYSFSIDYLKADYIENYVRRANKVLKFLRKQDWIISNKIIVAGHSQGARIAVRIAASNKHVKQLGLFGYNPNGRIDQSIRQARKDAEKGTISWEEADSIQQEQYHFYKYLQNEDSVKIQPELISWRSFSEPTISELIELKIPVYIAYGSNDLVADFCDLLPLFFIKKGKENYQIKRFPHLEHNFFPIDEKGEIDYSNGQWNFVFNEFISWIKD